MTPDHLSSLPQARHIDGSRAVEADGGVPAGTQLASKPEGIKDWDGLSVDEWRLFARQMEVFAGFTSHTDHKVGRLLEALEGMGELGELDDTLFLYRWGDNGASAEHHVGLHRRLR